MQDNVYLGGGSTSDDFPLVKAIQTTQTQHPGWDTPTLAKFSPTGEIVFSTFVGGGGSGAISGVGFDLQNNTYVTGQLEEYKLVTTPNAFQSIPGGNTDAFIIKLDPRGSTILYASYLGGSSRDSGYDIKVDANGYIYVYGETSSSDFPVKNSLQDFLSGGVLMDCLFITKLTPSANALVYSTFLGGRGNENAGKIALDANGTVYVSGTTAAPNFPVVNAFQSRPGGGFDGILAKISDNTPVLPSPLATNPGRLLFRYIQGDAVPVSQTVTISGGTFTATSPVPWLNLSPSASSIAVSVDPFELAPGTYNTSLQVLPTVGPPASVDITLTVLAAAPVLTSADPSFIPLNSNPTTVTFHGSGFTSQTTVLLYSVPFTPVQFVDSNTLKITLPENMLNGTNNFVFSVENPNSDVSNTVSVAVGTPAPQIAAVANAASFATGAVAPGEIVSIFGNNLDPNVTFDFIPATMIFSSATQINVTVPYAIAGPTTSVQSGSSAPVKLNVAPSAPGIFAAAPAGDNILTLYATGCGALTNDALPRCALPVSVTVNNQPATVLYAGIAPGLVQGANQVNIELPDGVTSGPLTIVLTAGVESSAPFSFNLP